MRLGAGAVPLIVALLGACGLSGAPAVAQSAAYVTNQTGDSLSVVDLATMKVRSEVKIGGKPAGIAVSPDGARAYLTAPDGKDVVVVDTTNLAILRRIKVGQGPVGIASAPDGRIYVADWYDHKLYALDPDAGTVVGAIGVGQSPSGVAVTPDGATVITADRDSNEISIIDAKAQTRVATVKVGTRPFGVTIDPSGHWAFTANVGSDDVSVVDIAGREVIGTVKVGRRPYAVALAAGRGFVTNQYMGTVSVFGLGSLRTMAEIEVGDHPEGIAADRDGRFIYVACWGDNVLVKIDAASLNVVGRVGVGDGPRAFGAFLK